MKKLFNPDNIVFRAMSRIADYFILSMCWLACCIPAITAGSASIALYDTVTHCIRNDEGSMLKRFFGTFRKELTRGVLLTVLWVVICLLLNMGYEIIAQLAPTSALWMAFGLVYLITLAVPLSILCWLVALESRFDYGFGELHRNALLVTFAYLPSSIAIAGTVLVAATVILYIPIFVMILPAIAAHLQSLVIERVFRDLESVEAGEEV